MGMVRVGEGVLEGDSCIVPEMPARVCKKPSGPHLPILVTRSIRIWEWRGGGEEEEIARVL